MASRRKRTIVNKVDSIQPINQETNELTMITPDTNPTEMPYQGYITNQDFYNRMQSSCFDLDKAMSEIIEKRFTGNALRNMSDENAIEAFKAMDNAKNSRTKQFLDLANHMSNNDFFKKMAEIERLRMYGQNKIIDCEYSSENTLENSDTQNQEVIEEIDRTKEQHVIKLLQLAVMKKLEEQKKDKE